MSLEVYNIVKAKITTDDLEAYKKQADKMKEATQNEPGTISYDFFINEEKREALIVEKYVDGEAFISHMNKFTQPEYIPTLLSMQELISVEMPGAVTQEMEELFNEGGWSFNAYPLNI
jgi:quinol monooxygenase YgiN